MNKIENLPPIEKLSETEIDAELDEKIREFLLALFPNWGEIFKTRRAWHDAKPVFTILARDADGRVVGHVAVVERTITTCWNWRYVVASVQGVGVDPEFRGTGLSTRLLDAALSESARAGYPFAILFCREPLVPFYERNGWRLPGDSMIMWRDRALPIHMRSNCPMFRELGCEKFPEGPIDVHNPF